MASVLRFRLAAIPRGSDELAGHWDTVYATHATDEVSWYQAEPATSLALVAELDISRDAAVIDVGAARRSSPTG